MRSETGDRDQRAASGQVQAPTLSRRRCRIPGRPFVELDRVDIFLEMRRAARVCASCRGAIDRAQVAIDLPL